MIANKDKLNELIVESFKYPDNLKSAEERFEERIKKERRYKKTFISTLSAVAASLMFVLLVNTSTAFANVVAELPVIGKLAEYVKFDKSLSLAIENEYVQEVNLIDWDGENSLLLPYLIADEKNLVLFFQLPDSFKQESNQWVNVFLDTMRDGTTGEEVEDFGYSTSGLSLEARDENHGFIMQEYHFPNGGLPRSIDVAVEMKIENIVASEQNVESTSYDDYETPSLEKIGTFNFHIELDEFEEPKVYGINETHTVMGQKIIIESMAVYPTGTEVNFSFPDENTAWIKSLELEVLQDSNTSFKGNNGISSMNDEGNKKMRVFIESNYFNKPNKQELLIKAVRFLNKDEEYITVDIDNKIITPKIKGTKIKQVNKNNGTVNLVFSTDIEKDDNHYSMFEHEYKDTSGNVYKLNGEGTSSSVENQMETFITVKYPYDGKVILKRTFTPKVYLDKPISIDIK